MFLLSNCGVVISTTAQTPAQKGTNQQKYNPHFTSDSINQENKTPKLILPIGHFFGVNKISTSQNEKFLASLDVNNNFIIWEIKSKKEIYRIKSELEISEFLFTDNSNIIYFIKDSMVNFNLLTFNKSTNYFKVDVEKARVFNNYIYIQTKSGNLLSYYHDNDYYSTEQTKLLKENILDFDIDSNSVFCINKLNEISFFLNNKFSHNYQIDNLNQVYKISKQFNGSKFCFSLKSGDLVLYDTLNSEKKIIYNFFNELANGISFSKNGKFLYSCSNDYYFIKYDILNNQLDGLFFNDYCTDLKILNNGSFLMSCYDGNIFEYNENLDRKGVFRTHLEKACVYNYIDSENILIGLDDGSINHFNQLLSTKKSIKLTNARISNISKGFYKNQIIISAYDGSLFSYDKINNYYSLLLKYEKPIITAFSDLVNNILVVVLLDEIVIYDNKFKLIRGVKAKDPWFLNESEKKVVIGGTGEIYSIDKLKKSISTIVINKLDSTKEWIAEAHYSEKDDSYYIGSYNGNVYTYKNNLLTLKKSFGQNLHQLFFDKINNTLFFILGNNEIYSADISKDFLLNKVYSDTTLANDNTWNIDKDSITNNYIISSGNKVHYFNESWKEIQDPIINSDLVCEAPDSRKSTVFTYNKHGVFTICYDGSYYWRPIEKNIIQKDFISEINKLTISRNLNCDIKSFSYKDYIYSLELSNQKKISYLQLEKNNWLVYDEHFRYDGTKEARDYLYSLCVNEIIDLSQIKDSLWVPDLANRISQGEEVSAPKLDEINVYGLNPLIQKDVFNKDYYFKITPRNGGVGNIVFSMNNGSYNRQIKESDLSKEGDNFSLKIYFKDIEEYLKEGSNQLLLKVYTKDNLLCSKDEETFENPLPPKKNKPNLYGLFIGVSNYEDENLNLKYASKDATDLSKLFAESARNLLNNDNNEHVFIYNLVTRNKTNKLTIKSVIDQINADIKSNDIFVIFYAGHGVLSENKNEVSFLTSSATKENLHIDQNVGFTTKELIDWLKPEFNKSQKRILIFDACNSGQAINDITNYTSENTNYLLTRGINEDPQQIKTIEKLNEQTGFFIISASESNKVAYEYGRYSQGLLTYSLLRTIKQNPSILSENNKIDVSRWFNSSKELAQELAKEIGKRQVPQLVSSNNFPVGIVNDDVKSNIVLSNEKPIFGKSELFNTLNKIDNFKIRFALDKKLEEFSHSEDGSDFIFEKGSEGKDIYTINGSYTITKNNIKIDIILVKGGDEIKKEFTVSGSIESLGDLCNQIITIANKTIQISQ